jgi:hypothetical protein
VYALARSGELPAVKVWGRGIWRVDRHKLDQRLEQLEKQTHEWAKANPLNPKANPLNPKDRVDRVISPKSRHRGRRARSTLCSAIVTTPALGWS